MEKVKVSNGKNIYRILDKLDAEIIKSRLGNDLEPLCCNPPSLISRLALDEFTDTEMFSREDSPVENKFSLTIVYRT